MVTQSAIIRRQEDSADTAPQFGRVVVAIHQPNYIPWLGYFAKISRAHKFVFLDTVSYSHGGFTNRNAIKAPNGSAWLTIPVLKSRRSGQLINEVETSDTRAWRAKQLATLKSNYGRAPFFKQVYPMLEHRYCDAANKGFALADFNIGLICAIADYLAIRVEYLRSSQLDVAGQKTDLLVDICRTIGATMYLAGSGGKAYQEDAKFEQAGIAPRYSSFAGQPYPQMFGEFASNLSVVDALMNCGCPGTRALLGLDPVGSR
jgi:hypothetical protein